MTSALRAGTSPAAGGHPAGDVPTTGVTPVSVCEGHRARGAVTAGRVVRRRRGGLEQVAGGHSHGAHQSAAALAGGTAPRGRWF